MPLLRGIFYFGEFDNAMLSNNYFINTFFKLGITPTHNK